MASEIPVDPGRPSGTSPFGPAAAKAKMAATPGVPPTPFGPPFEFGGPGAAAAAGAAAAGGQPPAAKAPASAAAAPPSDAAPSGGQPPKGQRSSPDPTPRAMADAIESLASRLNEAMAIIGRFQSQAQAHQRQGLRGALDPAPNLRAGARTLWTRLLA